MSTPSTAGGRSELDLPGSAHRTRSSEGDQRRLALHGGLWLAASQLLPAFGTAALSIVAAARLGPTLLGQLSLIAYVNMAVAAVIGASLTNASLRQLGFLKPSAHDGRLQRLSSWATGAHVGAGLLVCAAMVTTGLVVGRNEVSWGLIGLVSLVDATAMAVALPVVVREGWAPIGRLSIAFRVAGPLLGIAAITLGFGITGVFAADGVAVLGFLAALVFCYRRRRCPAAPRETAPGTSAAPVKVRSGGDDRREAPWRDRTRLLPPIAIAATWGQFALLELVVQLVSRRAEFIVLELRSTSDQIAMFSVAFVVVGLLAVIPSAVASAALPLIAAAEARGALEAARRHLRLAVRLGTLVSLPLAATVAALGPATIMLVYGAEYTLAAQLVPLASLALLTPVLIGVCTQFWAGQGRLWLVLACGGVAGVIDIGLAIVLVPELGATGAMIAKIVGQASFAAFLGVVTVRRAGAFGWDLPRLVAMTVASLLAGASALLASTALLGLVPDGALVLALLSLTASGLLAVLVGVGAAILLKVLSQEEASWLAPILPDRLAPLLRLVTR